MTTPEVVSFGLTYSRRMKKNLQRIRANIFVVLSVLQSLGNDYRSSIQSGHLWKELSTPYKISRGASSILLLPDSVGITTDHDRRCSGGQNSKEMTWRKPYCVHASTLEEQNVRGTPRCHLDNLPNDTGAVHLVRSTSSTGNTDVRHVLRRPNGWRKFSTTLVNNEGRTQLCVKFPPSGRVVVRDIHIMDILCKQDRR